MLGGFNTVWSDTGDQRSHLPLAKSRELDLNEEKLVGTLNTRKGKDQRETRPPSYKFVHDWVPEAAFLAWPGAADLLQDHGESCPPSSQQQHMGMLNTTLSIRLWLSQGKVEANKRHYSKPFERFPLEGSVAALKQFNLPKFLLKLAVLLYVVVFGLYLLYAWLDHAEVADDDGGRKNDEYRNIFVAFVATVDALYVYVAVVARQAHSARKRTVDFDHDGDTTFVKPLTQRQLGELLQALDGLQDTSSESGEVYKRLFETVTELQSK